MIFGIIESVSKIKSKDGKIISECFIYISDKRILSSVEDSNFFQEIEFLENLVIKVRGVSALTKHLSTFCFELYILKPTINHDILSVTCIRPTSFMVISTCIVMNIQGYGKLWWAYTVSEQQSTNSIQIIAVNYS